MARRAAQEHLEYAKTNALLSTRYKVERTKTYLASQHVQDILRASYIEWATTHQPSHTNEVLKKAIQPLAKLSMAILCIENISTTIEKHTNEMLPTLLLTLLIRLSIRECYNKNQGHRKSDSKSCRCPWLKNKDKTKNLWKRCKECKCSCSIRTK